MWYIHAHAFVAEWGLRWWSTDGYNQSARMISIVSFVYHNCYIINI